MLKVALQFILFLFFCCGVQKQCSFVVFDFSFYTALYFFIVLYNYIFLSDTEPHFPNPSPDKSYAE